MKKKILAAVACVLALCCVIGTTVAYFTVTTHIKNVFVIGDVDVEFDEETGTVDSSTGDHVYTMVPGEDISKDPKVTVKAGSEKCWLFVKINKENNLDNYLTYTVKDIWTAYSGVDGLYYKLVEKSDSDQAFDVLKDNKVTVKTTVDKSDIEALKESEEYPVMDITIYAIQYSKFETKEAAWAEAGKDAVSQTSGESAESSESSN